jgi:hypothetical protein
MLAQALQTTSKSVLHNVNILDYIISLSFYNKTLAKSSIINVKISIFYIFFSLIVKVGDATHTESGDLKGKYKHIIHAILPNFTGENNGGS